MTAGHKIKTLMEACSPTAAALLNPEMQFFPCRYRWHNRLLGILEESTVIIGVDAEAALQSFKSKNRHLLEAWIPNKEVA